MTLRHPKIALCFIVFSRMILLLVFQGAAWLLLSGKSDAFYVSTTYWTVYVTLTNMVLLALMLTFDSKTGYTQIFKFEKKQAIAFLKWIPLLLLSAMGPNLLLSYVIYGDLEIGAKLLLFDHGLLITALNFSLFPILQGLTEIPFYFLVLKPMLKSHTRKPLFYLGIPILILSLQHIVMPLYLDVSYVLYRGLMFLGFAILIGILIERKPNLMPYFMVMHILMNLSFMMMQLMS
ncbi:MAG: hypothetical protein EA375_06445 [Acholeplasmataceae bacterium]|nr:MAG: hypothetical protein EA375_06445 [Acholeplasmataceae bacterium]